MLTCSLLIAARVVLISDKSTCTNKLHINKIIVNCNIKMLHDNETMLFFMCNVKNWGLYVKIIFKKIFTDNHLTCRLVIL